MPNLELRDSDSIDLGWSLDMYILTDDTEKVALYLVLGTQFPMGIDAFSVYLRYLGILN